MLADLVSLPLLPVSPPADGNKLFQSTFIGIIQPQSKNNVIVGLEWTLLNSSVALVGYYFAAFSIDKPWMGRKRMQSMVSGRQAQGR